MNTLGKKLKYLRLKKGLTQEQLSKIFPVNRSSIANWELGRNKPATDDLIRIAEIFSVSVDYVLGLSDKVMDGEPKGMLAAQREMRTIPILGSVSAGVPLQEQQDIIGWLGVEKQYADGNFFALIVNGDSMEDELPHGAIITVKQTTDWKDGQICVVVFNGETCVKRVYRNNGTLNLISENKKYPPMIISAGSVYIQGVVIKKTEDVK